MLYGMHITLQLNKEKIKAELMKWKKKQSNRLDHYNENLFVV